MNKTICTLSFLSFCFMIGCGGRTSENVQKSKSMVEDLQVVASPNIILITINSLRADHVGAYGYARQTTPNFDEFAKDNVFFSSAYATSSWQMPSHGSMLTSLYPSEHGATHINNRLSVNCKTLPEILAEQGYYSAGFCCNPRLTSKMGFARGFDFYDDYSVEMLLANISLYDDDKIDINQQRTNDLINQLAMRWLGNNKSEPFFLYLHYYDNHWDYLPPEPYYSIFDPEYNGLIDGRLISKEPLYSNPPSQNDTNHIVALYDGEVRQTDEDLGVFLRYLTDSGLMENSVVVVVGEHGEQFYEHGNTSHHGLYEEMIRIPMAMHLPDSEAFKNENLVSQVDIMPTILDVANLYASLPKGSRGASIVKFNDDNVSRDWVYAEYTGGAIPRCSTLRSKRYKVIQSEGEIEVYDLESDKQELRPLKKSQYNNMIDSLITSLSKIENGLITQTPVFESQ